MARASKWIAIIVGIIIALIFIFFIVVAFVARSLDIKSILTTQVKEHSGRDLVIAGQLKWHVFPTVSVEINNADLSSPTDFPKTDFIKVKHLKIALDTWALFAGKAKVEAFTIDGATINLVENKSGQGNWENVKEKTKPVKVTAPKEKTKVETKTATTDHDFAIEIPNLKITDANIFWSNQKTGQHFKLQNATITASDVKADQAFPVSIAFDIANKKPAINGDVKLSSQLKFSQNKVTVSSFELQTKLQGKVLPEGKLNSTIRFNVAAQDKMIKLSDFDALINDSHITGGITMTDISKLQGEFNFKVNQLNLDPYLAALNQLEPKPKAKPAVKQPQKPATTVSTSVAAAPTSKTPAMHITGKVVIDALQAYKVKVRDINASIQAINGVVTVKPVTAKLYDGELSASLTANLNTRHYQLQAQLQKMQIEPLLVDLYGYKNFTGTTFASIALTTSGQNPQQLLQHLNGGGQFDFQNGSYKGLDAAYFYRSGLAILKPGFIKPGDNDGVTKFGHLKGTYALKNGVFSSNDLLLQSPVLKVTGSGQANLVTQALQWKFIVSALKGSLDNPVPLGPAIPFDLTGTFKHHKFTPDLQGILKNTLQNVVQDQAKKQLKGVVEKGLSEGLKKLDIGGGFF